MSSTWEMHRDPSTGKSYYHNRNTGDTVWHKPDGFDRDSDSDGSDSDYEPVVNTTSIYKDSANSGMTSYHANPLLSAVEEKRGNQLDAFDFDKYLVNQEEAAAAEKERRKAARREAREKARNEEAAEEEDEEEPINIGMGWHSKTDKTSGRTYYANVNTRQVSWEWPKEVPRTGGVTKKTVPRSLDMNLGPSLAQEHMEQQEALSEIYGKHALGPQEPEKKISSLRQRKKVGENDSGSAKYMRKMEERISKVEQTYEKENTTSGLDSKLSVLEEKLGEESVTLERRRGLLFFGVETLDEDVEVIKETRSWQAMTFDERVEDAKRKAKSMNLFAGILTVLKAQLAAQLHKALNSKDDWQRTSRESRGRSSNRKRSLEEWIEIAGEDAQDADGRLNWNTDLYHCATQKKLKDEREKRRSIRRFSWIDLNQEAEDEGDINIDEDLLDGDQHDEDPSDPCKYESTCSMHVLTMYACNKVFCDDNPLPQTWAKARTFVALSWIVVVMQCFVMFRLVNLVALENDAFHGIAEFPIKYDIHMANDFGAPRFKPRIYVDYTSDFDPTRLNPNGCTKNDYLKKNYCDEVCDDFPCTCEHVCVRRLNGIGRGGVRDGRKDGFSKTKYHKAAALEYTMDSNWCLTHRHRILDVSDSTNNLVTGVPTTQAHLYPSFYINQTIIKRCISCHDVLASVSECVRNGKKGSACDQHSQELISRCALKVCPSSMQINEEDLFLDTLDFPGLMFMYVVIGLILVVELRELFISDIAFRRCIKNCKVMGYMDESRKWLAVSLRLLQQLRRFFMLPGVVILMCIFNFQAESMLDVLATAIEMAFILDIDNLFYTAFFSTSGEADLMGELLKVRLSKRQEIKLAGASFLSVLCGVFQLTFFSLKVFRGKRCTDERTLLALMESVTLAQSLALLPNAFTNVDNNILKIQRYKKLIVGHGTKTFFKSLWKIWKNIFFYGMDTFLMLCIPSSTWIATFTAEYFLLAHFGAEAPMTYIFLRQISLLMFKFVPWHVLLSSLLSIFIGVFDFGDEFLESINLGDEVYKDWRQYFIMFVDWIWCIAPSGLALYGAGMIPGPYPYFGFSMENEGGYKMSSQNSTLD